MRFLCCLLLFALACSAAQAQEQPPNKLTPEQIVQGWELLFDGVEASGWKIEGDHAIVDGVLVLGGERKTKAFLPSHVRRNFQMRFQYHTEGKESSGIGWSHGPQQGDFIPGIAVPVLSPRKNWHDSFVIEHWEIEHFQQRFLTFQSGSSGIFRRIDFLWFEVPAGNKLHLRNIRFQQKSETAEWLVMLTLPTLAILSLVAAAAVWFWWRRRRQRSSKPGVVNVL